MASFKLTTLLCVRLPPFLDDLHVRKALLKEFHIEVGEEFCPLAGKVWRIGLIGESSREEYILMLLSALEQILTRDYGQTATGASMKAAMNIWNQPNTSHSTFPP
ncbi:hypothetical protein [Candidatus Nitrospira salsa]